MGTLPLLPPQTGCELVRVWFPSTTRFLLLGLPAGSALSVSVGDTGVLWCSVRHSGQEACDGVTAGLPPVASVGLGDYAPSRRQSLHRETGVVRSVRCFH